MIDINFSFGCLKTFINYGLSHSHFSVFLFIEAFMLKLTYCVDIYIGVGVRFPTLPQLYSTTNTLPLHRPKMKMRQSSICHHRATYTDSPIHLTSLAGV